MPAQNLKHLELINKKMGRLTILEVVMVKTNKRNRRAFSCICDCGNKTTQLTESILSGNTTSCGCARKEIMRIKATKHGYADKDNYRKGYRSWYAMRSRCENPKHPRYMDWGGRGIAVCQRWRDFKNFINDMGERPSLKHSIDRIDNNGNYEPANCRWATPREQNLNQGRFNK